MQQIDIAPTIVGFAGLLDEGLRGRYEGLDLLEYLEKGKVMPNRLVYSESTLAGPEIKQVRSAAYKLVYHAYSRETEFFDLISDPGEQNNLSGKAQEPYSQMFDKLRGWIAWMEKGAPSGGGERRLVGGETKARGDRGDDREREELVERLKALGYLQ